MRFFANMSSAFGPRKEPKPARIRRGKIAYTVTFKIEAEVVSAFAGLAAQLEHVGGVARCTR